LPGQRLLDLAYNERNRRYAQRLLDEVKTKIRAGVFDAAEYFPEYAELVSPADHTGGTFGKLADAWLASLERLASSTQISYQRTLDLHWRPHLGDRRIETIRYSELEALLASLPLITAKTRNNTLIPLRGVFEFARKDRRISDNPAALLQNAPVQLDPPDPLTLEEMNTILADMATHYPPEVGDYFEAALTTGMRPSELIAVEWRDLNEKSRELRVQRARVWGKDKPKTKTNTVRDIELTDRAFTVVMRQKPKTFVANGAIFWNPNTRKPWADEQVQRRYWIATLARLGIRHRDAYQTRHTFATLTIMDGVNAVWVGRQMGHASLRMTLDVYAKWIDKADRGRERDKASMAFRGREFAAEGGSKARGRKI